MGCYNGEGCISGLPIHYGDPIGGLICLSTADYDGSELITPVWPIIWGEYDDYGGIQPSTQDIDLEEYFGNRKNLLRDLERITHGCRNQVEGELPENLCLILEHRDVLKTLIAFGQPNLIKKSLLSGSSKYKPDFSLDACREARSLYVRHDCYRDNRIFLKLFREHHNGEIPSDKIDAYIDSVALYESLINNNIFLRWQRFAGWQEPCRNGKAWAKLGEIYHNLTNYKDDGD